MPHAHARQRRRHTKHDTNTTHHKTQQNATDILSTAFFCADQGGVKPGDAVAVVGAGPVGLLAVLAARERGAAKVISIDGVESRRRLAAELGAEAVEPGAEADAAVAAATAGRGADVVLECVGAPAALAAAFELARPAGAVASVGVQVGEAFPFSPVDAYNKNATLRCGVAAAGWQEGGWVGGRVGGREQEGGGRRV